VGLTLAVFLLSTIVIAFDSHDFACLKPRCSICEVKKVYYATAKTVPQDTDFLFVSPWVHSDRFDPAFLDLSGGRARVLSSCALQESDRAPPILSLR
jgi:hypothetical protein